MFDWNDEELANIIWGEDGETDDHIVPYPEGNEDRPPGLYGDHIKKEWNQEATNPKPSGQNKPVAKNDYTVGDKQERALRYDTAEGNSVSGYRRDPWPDLSLSHAAKTYQDSVGIEVSNKLTESTRFDSLRRDASSQLDDTSSIFQNQHEDGEQSDFVDYGWDNIGSFDDLDRIFSDDDQIFGHVSLGNADQQQSSSTKEATCTAEESFALCMDSTSLGLGTPGSTSGHFEVKTEYLQDEEKSFTPDSGKMNYLSSHAQKNVHASVHQVDFAGGKSKSVAKEKTELETFGKTLAFNPHLPVETITGSNEFTYKTCTGSVPKEQTQLQICNLLVAPSVQGNIRNQYSTMTNLPQVHSREDNKSVLSGYEVSPSTTNPSSRFPGTLIKPLMMTPQEKIEKLRRRQQMQALLAIQKQQQQFSHQVPSSDQSAAQKCLHDDQIQLIQGGNIEVEENVSSLVTIYPKSTIEHDNSNTISMLVDDSFSVEEIVLYRLQDIIAKLDIQIRLCIRDSLFRLAQSAGQRHDAGDTSSTNKSSKDEVIPTEETSSHNRFTRLPELETETNHIDRVVAHLLFHRPELFGIHPKTPESPASTKLPFEKNDIALLSSQRGFLPDSCKNKQNPPYHGPKNPQLFAEGGQSKNHLCIETSGNSSNEASDAGGMEIEAPQ